MKKSLSLILALAMVFTMFASVVSADDTTAATPTSVTATTYTPEQAFDFLKAAGIVEGNTVNGEIVADLNGNLTRAQFAKVITKLWGYEENAAGASVYSDLSGAGWATGYIGAATKAGLLNGMGGGKFNPSGNVKLEEIAKVVATGLKLPSVDYKGTGKVSSWAKGYVGAVIAAKLVDDSADFTKAAKRSEIFTIGYAGYKAIEDAMKPTPTPVPASKQLDIASAVALNSKVVEVTLATAAVAADLTVANVKAKTGTTDLVVSAVAAAPYNTDGKVVLVTLAADTTVGTLYTLTSGTKSVNFGGQPVDTTPPTVKSITVSDYNEIVVTFSEPVQVAGAVVTAAESYGAKAALATSGFAYGADNTQIKVTTDAQKGSTLYALAISAVKDFAGNTIVADNAQTFVGTAKPTDANSIASINPYDSKSVKVKYALKVDATTSLDKTKYAVALSYGTKAAIEVTGVTLDADDASGKTVILTLASDTVSQLYTLTIATGVTTKYGVATTAALSNTFVGIIADVIALSSPVATPINNTSLKVTFGTDQVADAVDATTAKEMFVITEAYGTKAVLAITGISIAKNVVTLTTGPQSGVLYNVVVKSGIKDAKGNATTADLTTTVVGSVVEAKISSITSATLDAAGTTLTVVFGGKVGATVTDVSHYTINNSVGYPTKAVKGTGENTVLLTVPTTSDNKLYVLTVKGLENSDGVAMDAAGITKTFSGKGNSATKPAIQAVIATDKQTLNIYFDRDVTDSKIDGVIWNSANNTINANQLDVLGLSGTYGTLGVKHLDAYNEYAYQDATNKNVLVVRVDSDDFKVSNARANGTFAIDGLDGSFVSAAASTAPFSPSTVDIAAISVSNIMALSTDSIRVYFNQAVTVANNDFATVEATATAAYGTGRTLSNGVAIDSTNTIWEFKLNGAALAANTSYWLVGKPTSTKASIHDYAVATASNHNGFVTLVDQTTSSPLTIENVSQFAGTGTVTAKITSAQVVSPNKKTIEIYFPQAMNQAEAKLKTNYELFDAATGTTQPGLAGWIAANTVASAYDSATNKVTLTLKNVLPTTAAAYFVAINAGVHNAIGTSNVQASATDGSALRVQVAPSSVAAPLQTVTSATYTTVSNEGVITITLGQTIKPGLTITDINIGDYITVTVNSGTDVTANINDVDTSVAGKITVTLDSTTPITAGGVGTITLKAALKGLNDESGDTASSASFSQ